MLPCKRLAEGEKSTVTIPQPRPLRAARSNSNSMDGRFGWLNTGLSTSDPAQPPVNLSQITRPPALACALPVLACDAAAILGYFHWRPDRQFHIHRFSISQGLYFFFLLRLSLSIAHFQSSRLCFPFLPGLEQREGRIGRERA